LPKNLETDDEEGLYIRDLMRLAPDEDELKRLSGHA
jgi:hypothetical protein